MLLAMRLPAWVLVSGMSLAAGPLSPVAVPAYAHALCVMDGGSCRGCGCKGGPGYRAPNGRCVSFKRLEKVCGPYPHARCAFENAPGTGANRACATHKHPKKRKRK